MDNLEKFSDAYRASICSRKVKPPGGIQMKFNGKPIPRETVFSMDSWCFKNSGIEMIWNTMIVSFTNIETFSWKSLAKCTKKGNKTSPHFWTGAFWGT